MNRPVLTCTVAVLAVVANEAFATAAEVFFPQGRSVFQTNEWIDISVVRAADKPLAAGELLLSLTGDGSRLAWTFPVSGGGTQKTEHFHVNGRLLRPGKYAVEVAVDGRKTDTPVRQSDTSEAAATVTTDRTGKSAHPTTIAIHSHVRQSSFRLINWGRADKCEEQSVQGEDSLGFNLFYGGYARDDAGDFMRAGVDFMANCVMSGGHQMDLRMECDWSDPYVTRGGTRRVVRRAMFDRTRPNVPGVHFYDEPGLTWHKHPATGEFGPHGVPAQLRSYHAAFDRDAPQYHTLDPNNPDDVARWKHWATWKLGLMDAAWKESQFGVSRVRPDFLSVTQSQYGWSAFTDGYYYNVVRSLPVTSGHGGYHDYGPGYFNPSYFLEMSRARDRWKPCWYLPTWYGNTTADQFRLEQYLSFQTNVQGLMSPPDCEPATNPGPRQGIVESNHLMKKLGTIFTTMPPTKPPVAMLYSLSQCLHTQTRDRSQNYSHSMPHGGKLPLTYLAGKLIQHQFFTVLDEDVLDGTLANDHQAVVLTSIDHLDPQVIAALEDFAAGGGLLLMTGDCAVDINGATKLPVAPRMPDQEKIDELMKAAKYNELGPYTTVGKYIAGATPLAHAIQAELKSAGIAGVFECDVPTIVASRQEAGGVEYLFAVNATPDADAKNEKGEPLNNVPKTVTATIRLPNDGRPVYDAVLGDTHYRPLGDDDAEGPTLGTLSLRIGSGQRIEGPQSFNEEREPGKLVKEFRFGPGQMRVFARTTKPIAGVVLARPVVTVDLVNDDEPLILDLAATVIDWEKNILGGSVPLQVVVTDSLGTTRFELFRATKLGQLSLRLPLAVNDAAGPWRVVVTELLSGLSSETTFDYTPPRRARSSAGATWRAVFAADDDDNAFRFIRTHNSVTIIEGASEFNHAAAERLIRILKPWGVECRSMPLSEAAKPRPLTADEAATWVGLQFSGSGQIKPGDANPPVTAGFAVQGPVILLGNPQDNAIIDFLHKEKFLPYAPDAPSFPGPGRGLFAWQRDGVGAGQESVALIAYDAAGLSEAVGSFYEAAAGIEPLTRWSWPTVDTLVSASRSATPSTSPRDDAGSGSVTVLEVANPLPDRIVGLKVDGKTSTALSYDGTLLTITDGFGATFYDGKERVLDAAEYSKLAEQLKTSVDLAVLAAAQKLATVSNRLVKFVIAHGERSAVVSWGGTIELWDKSGVVVWKTVLPQDITAVASDNQQIVVGLADGRLFVLK